MVITPPINTQWEYKLKEHLGFEEIVLFSKLSMLIIYSARTYYSSFYIALRYDNTITTSDIITHRTELQGNEYQL